MSIATTIDPEQAVRDAIASKTSLHILYCDREGDYSEREIVPIRVVGYTESWVRAKCLLRDEIRHFRFDRMTILDVDDEQDGVPEAPDEASDQVVIEVTSRNGETVRVAYNVSPDNQVAMRLLDALRSAIA